MSKCCLFVVTVLFCCCQILFAMAPSSQQKTESTPQGGQGQQSVNQEQTCSSCQDKNEYSSDNLNKNQTTAKKHLVLPVVRQYNSNKQ